MWSFLQIICGIFGDFLWVKHKKTQAGANECFTVTLKRVFVPCTQHFKKMVTLQVISINVLKS